MYFNIKEHPKVLTMSSVTGTAMITDLPSDAIRMIANLTNDYQSINNFKLMCKKINNDILYSDIDKSIIDDEEFYVLFSSIIKNYTNLSEFIGKGDKQYKDYKIRNYIKMFKKHPVLGEHYEILYENLKKDNVDNVMDQILLNVVIEVMYVMDVIANKDNYKYYEKYDNSNGDYAYIDDLVDRLVEEIVNAYSSYDYQITYTAVDIIKRTKQENYLPRVERERGYEYEYDGYDVDTEVDEEESYTDVDEVDDEDEDMDEVDDEDEDMEMGNTTDAINLDDLRDMLRIRCNESVSDISENDEETYEADFFD